MVDGIFYLNLSYPGHGSTSLSQYKNMSNMTRKLGNLPVLAGGD